MEIIEVNGYTQEEKLEIANRHLLPKQFTENGIKPKQLKLAPGLIGGHHRSIHR
jgi:ATP-dependent Lon protease